jgi:hypothetical protein
MSKSYTYICISTFCNACGLTCGHQGFFFQFCDIQNFTKFVWGKQKKIQSFPHLVKMKNIGDYNEFVQIMVTNYWIYLVFSFLFYSLH